MITLNQDTFPSGGGTYTLQLTKESGTSGWESVVLDSVSWITILSQGAVSNTVYEMEIEIDANPSASDRTAGLTADSIDETGSFTLTQEGDSSATLPVASIESVIPSGNINASGGQLVVDVLVTDGEDNLTTASITSGGSFVSLVSTQHGVVSGNNVVTRFTFNVAQNTSTSTRSLGITFTVSDGQNIDTATLSKTQDGATASAPSGTIVSVTPSGNIASSGGQLVYDVKVTNGNDSLTRASITTGSDFITLQSTTHGVTSGNDIVTRFVFTVAANESTSSRSIEILFTVENQYQTATVTGTKTQDGASSAPQVNIVYQDPTGNMPTEGGVFVVDVEAINGNDELTDASVEIPASDPFVALISTQHGVASGGKTVTRFTFRFGENVSPYTRSTSITFYVTDGTDTDSLTIRKTQDAKLPDPSGVIVQINPINDVPFTGGTVTYDVKAINAIDLLTTAAVVAGGSLCTLISTQHGLTVEGQTVTRFTFNFTYNPFPLKITVQLKFTFSNGEKTYSFIATKTQSGVVFLKKALEPNYSVLPWYNTADWQNAKKWWVYGKIYPLYTPAKYMLPFQILRPHRSNALTSFRVYKDDGTLVGEFISSLSTTSLHIKSFTDLALDVIVFDGIMPVFQSMANGRYFATLSDGIDTWTSDVFTVVNDISPYIKIEWYDLEDLFVDNGVIVYSEPSFKNVVYLPSDIAKPEYKFEEEGEKRDGYFFASKQISQKTYRFSFFAPEYLLDVMRLIRMSDVINIYDNHKVYGVDSFLMTPEWESNGDIAAVDVEFETATVVKKLGKGYTRGQLGNLNIEYNSNSN